eukprot:m.24171 g.24171  ORF g.24171 m.24171 type:complete len:163 (-) comp9082_c0_seq1:40-528(-)
MCKDCLKTPLPDRGTTCLSTGVYLVNFAGCGKCKKFSMPIAEKVDSKEDDSPFSSDDESEEEKKRIIDTDDANNREDEQVNEGQEEKQKTNADDDEDNEDDEHVLFNHRCQECNHLICQHEYTFEVDPSGTYQEESMSCWLCGQGSRTSSILPFDPREEKFF